ncbi:nitroreductase family protein [bacterium]|nr:nitroreductase family protein [bacterium]
MGHDNRLAEYEILPHILERWSPRSMTGDPILRDDLFAIFEAARFAPSAYNEQPWRFVFALSGTPNFDRFKAILVQYNWDWAKKASALLIVAAKDTFSHNGEPNKWSFYDCGCACGFLALEATRRGYVTHTMAGFSAEEAIEKLDIPEGYTPIVAIAIGKIAPRDFLPDELQEREFPSPRKPQSDFIFRGSFSGE